MSIPSNPTRKIVKVSDLDAVNLSFTSTEKKIFEYTFDVCLKDTNAFGNVYFAKVFEWQGVLREKWFSNYILQNMLELPGNLVTKDAYNQYFQSVYPFNTVKGRLYVNYVKSCSLKFTMEFSSTDGSALYSKGHQIVAYVDKNGKISKFPEEVKFKFLEFME